MTQLTDWQRAYASRPYAASECLVPATSLRTSASLASFHLGTGTSIFEALAPFILQHTQRELLLVTCFWAQSPSLRILNRLLRDLNAKAARAESKISVRLCFSSRSLWQKLFHTRSTEGILYPCDTWTSTLGLPPADELTHLDLHVKSIFVTPFSVMHPKFILCDRTTGILPSCNISWEDWFEGALTLRLPSQNPLVQFWRAFWGKGNEFQIPETLETTAHSIADSAETVKDYNDPDSTSVDPDAKPIAPQDQKADAVDKSSNLPATISLASASASLSTTSVDGQREGETDVLFLPHPHHANPRFRPYPLSAPLAPQTPLNECTTHMLNLAERQIWVLTPNLTAAPVIAALKDALLRGVHVKLITNEDLMVLEQIVTCFNTTYRAVQSLVLWYRLQAARQAQQADLERGLPLGQLEVSWFVPRTADMQSEGSTRKARQTGQADTRSNATPVKSHLKMCVVDDEVILLGSGNQDRASWYTSQELGYAIEGDAAKRIKSLVEDSLQGRLQVFRV